MRVAPSGVVDRRRGVPGEVPDRPFPDARAAPRRRPRAILLPGPGRVPAGGPRPLRDRSLGGRDPVRRDEFRGEGARRDPPGGRPGEGAASRRRAPPPRRREGERGEVPLPRVIPGDRGFRGVRRAARGGGGGVLPRLGPVHDAVGVRHLRDGRPGGDGVPAAGDRERERRREGPGRGGGERLRPSGPPGRRRRGGEDRPAARRAASRRDGGGGVPDGFAARLGPPGGGGGRVYEEVLAAKRTSTGGSQ